MHTNGLGHQKITALFAQYGDHVSRQQILRCNMLAASQKDRFGIVRPRMLIFLNGGASVDGMGRCFDRADHLPD